MNQPHTPLDALLALLDTHDALYRATQSADGESEYIKAEGHYGAWLSRHAYRIAAGCRDVLADTQRLREKLQRTDGLLRQTIGHMPEDNQMLDAARNALATEAPTPTSSSDADALLARCAEYDQLREAVRAEENAQSAGAMHAEEQLQAWLFQHGSELVRGARNYRAAVAEAQRLRVERDEWKNAIEDAAVVNWTLAEGQKTPKQIVAALLEHQLDQQRDAARDANERLRYAGQRLMNARDALDRTEKHYPVSEVREWAAATDAFRDVLASAGAPAISDTVAEEQRAKDHVIKLTRERDDWKRDATALSDAISTATKRQPFRLSDGTISWIPYGTEIPPRLIAGPRTIKAADELLASMGVPTEAVLGAAPSTNDEPTATLLAQAREVVENADDGPFSSPPKVTVDAEKLVAALDDAQRAKGRVAELEREHDAHGMKGRVLDRAIADAFAAVSAELNEATAELNEAPALSDLIRRCATVEDAARKVTPSDTQRLAASLRLDATDEFHGTLDSDRLRSIAQFIEAANPTAVIEIATSCRAALSDVQRARECAAEWERRARAGWRNADWQCKAKDDALAALADAGGTHDAYRTHNEQLLEALRQIRDTLRFHVENRSGVSLAGTRQMENDVVTALASGAAPATSGHGAGRSVDDMIVALESAGCVFELDKTRWMLLDSRNPERTLEYLTKALPRATATTSGDAEPTTARADT